MAEHCVGLISPGEMGAAVGESLVAAGRRVVTVLRGRGPRTFARAQAAGIEDVGSLETLATESSVIISIVPPIVASEVVASLAEAIRTTGSSPLVVEANAVSPASAERSSHALRDAGAVFVDADLIGGPPASGRPPTRLYLSGPEAELAADVLATPELRAVVLGGPAMAASSLKMAYASWTKGSAALVLAARALARTLGVEEALLIEWAESQPDLARRCELAAHGASRAWRFAEEMNEIAATHKGAGLHEGFGGAAAEIYRRLGAFKDQAAPSFDEVFDVLMKS